MDISTFAEKHRLQYKRGTDRTYIIPGKLGHIFDYGNGNFGVILLGDSDDSKLDNTLRARMRKAEREGLEPFVVGDFEGVFLFDPADTQKARLAKKLVGAKRVQRPRGRILTSERARELSRIRQSNAK